MVFRKMRKETTPQFTFTTVLRDNVFVNVIKKIVPDDIVCSAEIIQTFFTGFRVKSDSEYKDPRNIVCSRILICKKRHGS